MRYATFVIYLSFAVVVNVFAATEIDLPDLGDSAGSVISPEQERKIAKSFKRELFRQAPLETDEEIIDYLNKLAKSLTSNADYEGEFEICMINSKAINAFAVPGGLICFNSGLIMETQTEAELASVMAHEISHVTQRHGARMIEAASKMNIPTIAALVGSIALAAANPQAGYAAIMATQAAAVQYQINFTRANEREADALGISLLAKSGYNPKGMADFFGRMMRASRYSDPKLVPEYLRTHPLSVNRIAEAQSRVDSIGQGVVREEDFSYQLIWAKIRVLSEKESANALNFFEDRVATTEGAVQLAARYGRAIAYREINDFSSARREIEALLDKHPKEISFLLEAAAIEKLAGDYREASFYYSKAYKFSPNNRAAIYGLVENLLKLKKTDEALAILDEFKFSGELDSKFYKLQAETLHLLERQVSSKMAMAEHYFTIGETALAAEQLRVARGNRNITNYQRLKVVARLSELEKILVKETEQKKNRM
tara:strand:- start:1393 stop:2850 length:1458 start_codon:yes stop_codon:yes gene_type:complete